MADSCARCGERATTSLPLPLEWDTWLRENRDLGWTATHWVVPLCPDCYAYVDALQDRLSESRYFSEEASERHEEERLELLRTLDVDAFREGEIS